MIANPKSPRDFWLNLTQYKAPWNPNWEVDYVPYVIDKWCSMVTYHLPEAKVGSQIPYGAPKSAHYNYYLSVLPQKNLFGKFVKKTAKDLDPDVLEMVMQYFEIGLRDARDIVKTLDMETIKSFKSKFKFGRKQK